MMVASTPCERCAANPIVLIRWMTFSTCCGVALAFIMIIIRASLIWSGLLPRCSQIRPKFRRFVQVDMPDLGLRYVRIPVDEDPDDAWQPAWKGDLSGAEHRNLIPSHLAGRCRRIGRAQVLRQRKEGTGDVLDPEAIILAHDL